jgi:putative flippase GtrA
MDKAVKKLLDEFLTLQFIRFFCLALLAAVINFVARILLDPFVGYQYAIVVAYIIGTIAAFFLYQRKVFGHSNKPWWQESGLFVFVTLAAIAQTLIVSVLLAHHIFPAMHWTWHSKEIAHIIGMGVPMFSSFLGHKYLTFGQQSI